MGKRKKIRESGEMLKTKSESSSVKNSAMKPEQHMNPNNMNDNKKLSKALVKPSSEPFNLANEAKSEMASQPQKQCKNKHKNVDLTAKSKDGQKSSKKKWNRVIYINNGYRRNEIGDHIQNELLGLRRQSSTIKSASDLTESQTHVIKRQISRLQGGVKKIVKKRPKKYTMSIDDAAKELKLMIEKQKHKN